MHSEFVEFLVVLSVIPSVLVHFLAEVVECVRNECTRVCIGKFASLLSSKVFEFLVDFARYASALAENHSPHRVVHHDETSLALCHGEQVHEGDVLHILAERCHEWWITYARPYVFNLIEQLHEHVVGREFGLAFCLQRIVDHLVDTCKVCHHRAHHAAGKSRAEQERAHVLVAWVDEVAEPVVNELLGQ